MWQQKKLREVCAANGITVTAYSPLGAKGARWGTNQVMDCEVLKEIAKERGKTIAQVLLRTFFYFYVLVSCWHVLMCLCSQT